MQGDHGSPTRTLLAIAFGLALVASVPAQSGRMHIALARGARIAPYAGTGFPDAAYVYVDADDGALDPRTASTLESAREQLLPVLALRPDAPQYLRFAELSRACYRGARVAGATLVLTPTGKAAPARRVRLVALGRELLASELRTSFDAPISDRLDAEARLRLVAPTLIEDVQRWLDDRGTNFGWRLECDGELALHSSEAERPADRPRLELELELPLEDYDPRSTLDLGVAYVERLNRGLARRGDRAPRVERAEFRGYAVSVQVEPEPREREPLAPGAVLRFVAHVRNHGGRLFEGKLTARWELDGAVLERVESPFVRLGRHQGARFELAWTVDERMAAPERRIGFALERVAGDACANNDRLERPLLGRGAALRIEERVRDLLASERNAWGSFSCEDVAQWQLGVLNETWLGRSRDARYAPLGARERIVWEVLEIVPTGSLDPSAPHFARPMVDLAPGSGAPAPEFDAEIGWIWIASDQKDRDAAEGALKRALRDRAVSADHAFLCELATAALGLVDFRGADPSPRGFETLVRGGKPSGRRFAPLFPSPLGAEGLPLGPFDASSSGGLAPVEVLAIDGGLETRGGPRGHWLHAQPEHARIRLLDGTGAPLAGAHVDLWQQSGFAFDAEETVAGDLRTDANGLLELPQQSAQTPAAVRVPDGYVLAPSDAFGRLADDGSNAALLLRVRVEGRADWFVVSALDFALQHLSGTPETPLDLRVALPAARVELLRPAAAYALRGEERRPLPHLIDSRTLVASRWFALEPKESLVIDLGKTQRIGAVALVQSRDHGAFARRFRVEVALDETFAEPHELWPAEAAPFEEIFERRAEVDPSEPQTRRLHLGGGPIDGRFVRFFALEGGRCQLEEVEVYGAAFP